MKKLKLNLEDLKVESFETNFEKNKKGTIAGFRPSNDPTCNPSCDEETCVAACTSPGYPSCDFTCGNTCPATCGESCPGTCGAATCGESCLPTCNPTCDAPDKCVTSGVTCP